MLRIKSGLNVVVGPRHCWLSGLGQHGPVFGIGLAPMLVDLAAPGGEAVNLPADVETVLEPCMEDLGPDDLSLARVRSLKALDESCMGWVPGFLAGAGDGLSLCRRIHASRPCFTLPSSDWPTIPASTVFRAHKIGELSPSHILLIGDADCLTALLATRHRVTTVVHQPMYREWILDTLQGEGTRNNVELLDALPMGRTYDVVCVGGVEESALGVILEAAGHLLRPDGFMCLTVRPPFDVLCLERLVALGFEPLSRYGAVSHPLTPAGLVIDSGDFLISTLSTGWKPGSESVSHLETVMRHGIEIDGVGAVSDDAELDGLLDTIAMHASRPELGRRVARNSDGVHLAWRDEDGGGLTLRLSLTAPHACLSLMPYDSVFEYGTLCAVFSFLGMTDSVVRCTPRAQAWMEVPRDLPV